MTDNILISPKQLLKMTESLPTVIIDTRSPDAYATGHIPGAVNLHDIFTFLATSSKAGLEEPRDKFAEAFGTSGPSDMVAIKPGRTCTMSMSGSIAAHRLMALISAPAKDAFRAPSGWTGVG